MGKNNIYNKFSVDIDEYIDGIEKPSNTETREYNELLELGKVLTNKNFSKDSNKEEVLNNTLKNINAYGEESTMGKLKKAKHPITKVASVALVGILSISLMQTSFAQDLVEKVIRTISLGHITVSEMPEESYPESYPIPEEFKGKIFDKDGNPLKQVTPANFEKIYTASGEEIASLDITNGEAQIMTIAQEEEQREETVLVIKDFKEVNNYTCFNVILPSYLPDGYEFDRAELYKNENGIVENSKYASLYFTNKKTDKYILMQQRFADEETAYLTTTIEKIEKVEINGIDAIVGDRNIDWETSEVLYSVSGRGEITKDELIKIAESVK